MISSNNINVTHVSYAVSKQTASYRLHNELIKQINSTIFVSSKSLHLNSIIQPKSLFHKVISKIGLIREILYSKVFPHSSKSYFSYNLGPVFFQLFWLNKLFKIKTDIFHLHWIGNGFINLNQIHKFNKPIVITLHDVWFVTGGCHVNFDCKKYEVGCSNCPLFNNSFNPFDITSYIFNQKKKLFENKKLEIVVLSSWMKEIVLSSPIYSNCNVNLISNGLNTNVFIPSEKSIARKYFSLPDEAKIILFGGISAKSDFNKGYDLLLECLKLINSKNVELVVFGEKNIGHSVINGLKITNVGYLTDEESLALLYSAADVVIVPSRQESFSQVCLESISCGTPVVAFDYSGPRDIIIHKENGYLARPYDPIDLAFGVDWIFNELEKSDDLSQNAREIAVDKFDISKVSQMHLNLYNKILLNG
jgi:glycosyltransferase involved in cell wall biosynthesis